MDTVKCPYCGQEIEVEIDECTEWDEYCDNCEREFEITVEFDPHIQCKYNRV